MRHTLLILLLSCTSIFATDKTQTFNNYSGDFKLHEMKPHNFFTNFKGEVTVLGELVVSLTNDGEPNKTYVHKASFIPDDKNVFPYIKEGFYAKDLITVELMNQDEAIKRVFSEKEVTIPKGALDTYISKRGYFTLNGYGTSVECDSRHYHATFVAFTSEKTVAAYHDERKELEGC